MHKFRPVLCKPTTHRGASSSRMIDPLEYEFFVLFQIVEGRTHSEHVSGQHIAPCRRQSQVAPCAVFASRPGLAAKSVAAQAQQGWRRPSDPVRLRPWSERTCDHGTVGTALRAWGDGRHQRRSGAVRITPVGSRRAVTGSSRFSRVPIGRSLGVRVGDSSQPAIPLENFVRSSSPLPLD